MKSRAVTYRILIVTLALALALPLVANPALAKDNSGSARTSITLASPANIAGTALKAGEYTVIADGTKVTLKQNGKVVAEAAAQWAEAKQKYDLSSVVIEGNDIREIRFSGKSRYVVIR